ncbi:class-II fumarase/aspartase family protein [Mangrovihabitans endophyticus]|nr:adenylosuccinate lyase family protein [Mangrovihabitans endophyticus]
MNEPPVDAGLLSPVRAGAPVEHLVDDVAWLQAMLDAEVALVRAQSRLGTVPVAAAEAIARVAQASHFDVRELALSARSTANPIVGLVAALTAAVTQVDSDAAEYVHRGSTSQDIFDTAAMMVSKRALAVIREDLSRVGAGLAALAERHADTTMAGRTLAAQAVPTTFGLKAAGWRELVVSAEARIGHVFAHGLPVSLGGSAGTLGGYLEFARSGGPDRAKLDVASYVEQLTRLFAEECGLTCAPLPWHALRAPMADLAAALAFTTGALGKLAVDVLTLSRTEVAEAREPSAVGRGGSSAMPHKRNPVLSTMIRSASLQVPALATVLNQSLLSEDERSAGVWQSEWQVLRECLRLAGGAAHTAVELAHGLQPDPDRMRQNLELTNGQIVSERLAAALAPRLGKAAARKVMSEASAATAASGRPLAAVLGDDRLVTEALTAQELADLCAPEQYVGAASALVAAVLTPAGKD